MLWGLERGAAGACECFGWVCGSKPLGIGAREGVVHCKLECGGGGAAGIERAFGFLAL
jgi:hypothetical protein